jgi:5-methylcytosine-specific restriction protein A
MSAIILGWDPASWDRWNYAAAVDRVAASGLHVEPWQAGRDIPAGTDAWLVLQGTHGPGLLGHGVVAGTGAGQPLVAFDALLPLGDHVPADVLTGALPGAPWQRLGEKAGGASVELGPGEELHLRDLWARVGPGQGPDPTLPAPGTYPGNAVVHVPANRYERDPEARRACIAQRGTSCAACGFSFEVAYGEIGADFIDVHHTVPDSQLGSTYQLDPLTDLVPLCANCHAMAHRGVNAARTEVELRQAIANAGYLRGETASPEELEAQRIAREILGPG